MATESKSWDIKYHISPSATWGSRPDPIWFHEGAPAGGPRPISGKDIGVPPATASDPIDPAHYHGVPCPDCGADIEPWEFAEHMGFNLGNVFKYLWRAGKKGDRLEDLRKARSYLQREIDRMIVERAATAKD